MSDQTHSSLARAARALGFRPDQVRIIPTDEHARIRPDALRSAIAADLAARPHAAGRGRERGHDRDGRHRPVPRAGRDLPRARHLAPRRRRLRRVRVPHRARPRGARGDGARRLDHARSAQVAVPADRARVRCSSATAPRCAAASRSRPTTSPTSRRPSQEVNFSDLGLQLTRSCRALKLWISIRYFGLAAFRAAIDTCLDLALARAAAGSRPPRARADDAGVARRRHVPPPPGRRRRRGGARADEREPGRARSSARARSSSRRRRVRRPAGPPAVHPQPLDVAGRGRPCARAGGDTAGRRSPAGAGRVARELPADRAGMAAAPVAPRGRSRSLPLFASLDDGQASACSSPRTSTTRWPARRSSSSGRSAVTSTSSSTARSRSRRTARTLNAARAGRVLRRARRARLGRRLRPHALGHRDGHRADAAARPRLGVVNWLMKADPQLRRAARTGVPRAPRPTSAVTGTFAASRRRTPTEELSSTHAPMSKPRRAASSVQSLMLDCLPRTSNSPTWTRSLGGRRRAWRVESAMRTDCLVSLSFPRCATPCSRYPHRPCTRAGGPSPRFRR